VKMQDRRRLSPRQELLGGRGQNSGDLQAGTAWLPRANFRKIPKTCLASYTRQFRSSRRAAPLTALTFAHVPGVSSLFINLAGSRKRWARVLPREKKQCGGQPSGGPSQLCGARGMVPRRHRGDRFLRASARRLPSRRHTRLHERGLNPFSNQGRDRGAAKV